MPSPNDPVNIGELSVTPNGYYHIVPLPGQIDDTDAALDYFGKSGWDLVDIYGRNAVFRSRTNTQTGVTDAFGRVKTAIPYTLGDYKHLYDVDFNFVNKLVSGSTVTFNKLRASVTLQTSASAQSYASHQTKMYHNYMPGKSQAILSSVLFGAAEPGVIKRTGYFDDYNGIFFEQDETGSLNWVIRSATNGTGSITENRVPQTSWNVNKLLTDPVILDITKTQLVSIDFQWLGIGRVRCGLVINGETYLCHTFDHSNKTDKVYMSDPNLPVRCEIVNTTTATGSMEQICSTVVSEGGYTESGTTWALSSPVLRTITSGSSIPVMAIRLKNSYNGLPNRAFVRVSNLNAFSEDQTIKYRLVKLPSGSSISGGSWVSVDNASTVEYNVTATSAVASQQRELINGFVFAGGTGQGNSIAGIGSTAGVDTKINYIAQNFDSTDSEIYAVVVTNMTATSTDVGVGLTWKEVF